MSHSDNTSRKFNTNLPAWLATKLLAKEDEQTHPFRRTTRKQIWRKEIFPDLTKN
jgi:hypothetical protein